MRGGAADLLTVILAIIASVLVLILSCVGANIILNLCCQRDDRVRRDAEDNYSLSEDYKESQAAAPNDYTRDVS